MNEDCLSAFCSVAGGSYSHGGLFETKGGVLYRKSDSAIFVVKSTEHWQ